MLYHLWEEDWIISPVLSLSRALSGPFQGELGAILGHSPTANFTCSLHPPLKQRGKAENFGKPDIPSELLWGSSTASSASYLARPTLRLLTFTQYELEVIGSTLSRQMFSLA